MKIVDREQAKEIIKDRLEDYLRSKGIDPNPRKSFRCLNPEHEDNNPSMRFDPRRKKVHCFSCGADYDTLDLIGIDYGLQGNDLFLKAYDIFNLSIDSHRPDYQKPPVRKSGQRNQKREQTMEAGNKKPQDLMEFFQRAHDKLMRSPAALEYLHSVRGIDEETVRRFRLGYEENFREGTGGSSWKAIIIPTSKYTYTARNTDTAADKKNRVRKSPGRSVLMKMPGALTGDNPVFVVEGELDALSIAQAGGVAVALGSASNYRKFVDLIKKNGVNVPLIIIALDNDDEGKATTKKIIDGLGDIGGKSKIIEVPDAYSGCKDANELLVKDPDQLRSLINQADMMVAEEKEAEKREYLKTSVADHMDDFRKRIRDSAAAAFYPTGFPSLDDILDGGLYAGLYIIGAISSLGKTTFCLQVCDQIAAAGQDVLIFSLEMARDELIAKSISRITYNTALYNFGTSAAAKTTRGIMTGSRWQNYGKDELELLDVSMDEYSGYAGHLFIYEGVGNIGVRQIREIVERHIRVTRVRPVVMIDYLQIIAPYDPRATDKQNMDKAVLELKRLSRDDNIPIIGISSFNRENYMNPVSMSSFKESGAVEYSSDVLIGLQYAGMDYQKEDKNDKDRVKRIRELIDNNISLGKAGRPQKIQLKVLKNRNGSKGGAFLEYVSMFNCFSDPERREGSDPEPDPPEEEYKQMSINDGWMSADDAKGEDLLPDDWGSVSPKKI